MSRYRHDVPLDLHAPLTDYDKLVLQKVYGKDPQPEPDPRPSPHAPGCWCLRCWNAGLLYGEYLKAKRLEEL